MKGLQAFYLKKTLKKRASKRDFEGGFEDFSAEASLQEGLGSF